MQDLTTTDQEVGSYLVEPYMPLYELENYTPSEVTFFCSLELCSAHPVQLYTAVVCVLGQFI